MPVGYLGILCIIIYPKYPTGRYTPHTTAIGTDAMAASAFYMAAGVFPPSLLMHLISSRSACYMPLKDYEVAIADAEVYGRLGHRLAVARLALNQFEDAAIL
jgi:hypothetical protein